MNEGVILDTFSRQMLTCQKKLRCTDNINDGSAAFNCPSKQSGELAVPETEPQNRTQQSLVSLLTSLSLLIHTACPVMTCQSVGHEEDVLCLLAHCRGLLGHVNRTESLLMLLIPSVLLPLCQTKIAAVKEAFLNIRTY